MGQPGGTDGRTYLYVPFEKRDEAKCRDALWDADAKCWYVEAGADHTRFQDWLGDDGTRSFVIESEEAYIATARTRCWRCHGALEVSCLYCEHGVIGEEPYTQFSVSNISAVDSALERQLKAWPMLRWRYDKKSGKRLLTNHCPLCRAPQSDYYLHCEPDGAFFMISRTAPGPGTIGFERLTGPIRVDGDEGFSP